MIWNGKRYSGIQVYIGKRSGDFSGEYIVVYHRNGGGRMLDAMVGLMKGNKFPNISGGITPACLSEEYRPLSYKKIPEADRAKLEKWVTD